jgi:hypothetical protein
VNTASLNLNGCQCNLFIGSNPTRLKELLRRYAESSDLVTAAVPDWYRRQAITQLREALDQATLDTMWDDEAVAA